MNNKKKLITKSLNDEKRLATFVVLEPQDDDGMTTDLHTDTYTEDVVLEACLDFNKKIHLRKGKLIHKVGTDSYSFVMSYITEADMQVGDTFVKKGSWLQTIKVSESSDWLWEGIKAGRFNGLSVECTGVVEDIEEDE